MSDLVAEISSEVILADALSALTEKGYKIPRVVGAIDIEKFGYKFSLRLSYKGMGGVC